MMVAGAQTGIFQGRGGQGHFNKYFIFDTRKKGPRREKHSSCS